MGYALESMKLKISTKPLAALLSSVLLFIASLAFAEDDHRGSAHGTYTHHYNSRYGGGYDGGRHGGGYSAHGSGYSAGHGGGHDSGYSIYSHNYRGHRSYGHSGYGHSRHGSLTFSLFGH